MTTPRPATVFALPLLMCCASLALAADPKDRRVEYPAAADTPASLTLIAREGKVGRDNPFYDNYRPQLRFSADKHEVSCTVRIAPPREKVEPGETAEVALRCTEPFHVFEKNKSFVAYEGGRKVGEGRLRD